MKTCYCGSKTCQVTENKLKVSVFDEIIAVIREKKLPDDVVLSEIQDCFTIAGYDVPLRSYNLQECGHHIISDRPSLRTIIDNFTIWKDHLENWWKEHTPNQQDLELAKLSLQRGDVRAAIVRLNNDT